MRLQAGKVLGGVLGLSRDGVFLNSGFKTFLLLLNKNVVF